MVSRSVGGVNPLSFASPEWLFKCLATEPRHWLLGPHFAEKRGKKAPMREL